MKFPKAKTSIRWRMALIYFMLVFVAMSIVSVFLLNQIEDYQFSSLQQNIDNTVNESGLIKTLESYDDLTQSQEEIQSYLSQGFSFAMSEEISVVNNDLLVIASTNTAITNTPAANIFDAGLITRVMSSLTPQESDVVTAESVSVKNFCYPIVSDSTGETSGVVFIRADKTSINNLTSQSRRIFVRGTLIALVITVILGLLLANNITSPINKVTETVAKMSEGDFSSEVPVKSNDEIGQLATMFNMMQGKLDETLDEIQGEKSKLETILKYMADGLIAITKDGTVVHINEAARNMLGIGEEISASDCNYESILGHITPELSLSTVVNNSIEGDTSLNFDYNDCTFEVRYGRITLEDAGAGVLILLQDITERQKLEDMQKDFVANVSHELKTPLATVKAYTETLMDGGVDPDTSDHFLEIIDSEADRMTRLVKDLLQLSRLDHKQERWNIKEGNITDLLISCYEKMIPIAKQKKQTLTALFDKDTELRVAFDKDRFEQVILNIISNSVKYTDEGGHIELNAVKEGAVVNITISDDGFGISKEDLPRIFERFYRVDKARSRAMGSSGLGLAISKQIIEEHHGTIEVQSELGKGTTMIICLPLVTHRGIANIE
ncbi:MAG: ATP-binding protein [Bacillota bacterium]|nr:ATP-binding protein [Bacillota bacterium]